MSRSVAACLGAISAHARAICTVAVMTLALPAQAQTLAIFENGTINLSLASFTEDADTSQRFNLSNKLRMLSQRVVSDACFAHAGIATQDSLPALKAAISEVSAITHALEFGDTSLGVFGAEERRKTLAELSRLNELWVPMQAAALQVAQGDGGADEVAALNAQGNAFLRVAQDLATQITGQYANPLELRQADAMLIEIAGRQRTLSQQMSKNACLASIGMNTDAAMQELQLARVSFDNALGALSAGMPSLGIQAPPTAQIDARLATIHTTWTTTQPFIDEKLSGRDLDTQQLMHVYFGANDLTHDMDGVVGLYTAASQLKS